MTDNVRTLKSQKESTLGNDGNTNLLGDVFDIPHGLTIVVVEKNELIPFVNTTLTRMAQRGSKRLGVSIPRGSKVVSVCFGKRHARQMERLFAANTPAENLAPHKIEDLGLNRPICWTSSECIFVIKSLLVDSDIWLMLEQTTASNFNTAGSIGVLLSISEMARKAKSRIMLFIVIPEGGEKYQLDQCCDEYIAVRLCEPDFGCDSAFSIDVASLRYLNGVGIGKTMCNVRIRNGMFKRWHTPFISEILENRVIWALRSKGMTLDDIAELMKINKSTVLRRLQTMPPVRQIEGCDELISHYVNAPPRIVDTSEAVRRGVVVKINDENDERG